MKQFFEALKLAAEATRKFPLAPVVWTDLAAVHRARDEFDAEVQTLEKALEINPNWIAPICSLADAFDRQNDLPRARTLLEAAVARLPLEGRLWGYLADVLWQINRARRRARCAGASGAVRAQLRLGLERAAQLEPVDGVRPPRRRSRARFDAASTGRAAELAAIGQHVVASRHARRAIGGARSGRRIESAADGSLCRAEPTAG